MQIALFQHLLGEKKTSVHPSVGEKTQVWGKVNWGRCRRWNADFEAWAVQSGEIRVFGCQDLTKNVKFSNVLGVRHRCADRTREGRISERDAPERSSAPCSI
jgi:hypothetical protein